MTTETIAAGSSDTRGVEPLARQATSLLIEAAFAFWAHFVGRAAQLGLAPTQAHALLVMDATHPATMRDVADALGCDPSTITGVADRLEAQGLVERQAQAGDRRVRALALTRAGEERREHLIERLAEPPASVGGLDSRQLGVLVQILITIMAAEAEAVPGTTRCLTRAPGESH